MWNDERQIRRYYDFQNLLVLGNREAVVPDVLQNIEPEAKREAIITSILNALILRNDIHYSKDRSIKLLGTDKLIDQSLSELRAFKSERLAKYCYDAMQNEFVRELYKELSGFEMWMRRRMFKDEPKRKVKT